MQQNINSMNEWILLRDELINSSRLPSLTNSNQISSFILLALSSLSLLLHSYSIYLRLKQPSWTSKTFLPLIFFFNAILNIASISSLLSDANRSQFKSHTSAIQNFNYSLLLSAGVLTTWSLACGLSPTFIGKYASSRYPIRRPYDSSPLLMRLFPSCQLNLVAYSTILATFVIPLPSIILLKKAIDDINNLDDTLLVLVNQILESTDSSNHQLIDQALKVINQLDQTCHLLYFHIRMLSALQLFITFIILLTCCLVSIQIIRTINRKFGTHLKNVDSSLQLSKNDRNRSDRNPSTEPHLVHHFTISEPKPAFMNDSNKKTVLMEPQPEIDLDDFQNVTYESNHKTNHSQTIGNTSSFHSDLELVPKSSVDQDQSKKIQRYIKKIKNILFLISIPCLSFIILNFCVVLNLFKYPDEISLGDLLILKLEWSTWLWNGSMSPLIGFINCFILLKKNPPEKWTIPFSIF